MRRNVFARQYRCQEWANAQAVDNQVEVSPGGRSRHAYLKPSIPQCGDEILESGHGFDMAGVNFPKKPLFLPFQLQQFLSEDRPFEKIAHDIAVMLAVHVVLKFG